jgi:rhodanese-related sulfurtransferase
MENYVSLLPENKNEKIIIYCRSGSMGDTASQTLVDLGFTDVSNLEGGYNLWKASGLPFEE